MDIGGKRKLQTPTPTIGMHTVHGQDRTRRLRGRRLNAWRSILAAVSQRDLAGAEQAGRDHVARDRQVILGNDIAPLPELSKTLDPASASDIDCF